MSRRPRVTVTVDGQPHEVPVGSTCGELAAKALPSSAERPLGAIAYGKLVSLDCTLRLPTEVKFVTHDSREGVDIYRRTACLMLYAAVKDLHPSARVVMGQSLADGYYFDLKGVEATADVVRALGERMREYAVRGEPIHKEPMPAEEARVYFAEKGYSDKVALIHALRATEVRTVRLAGFRDIQHGPIALSAGAIRDFHLARYEPGMVLRFRVAPEADGAIPPLPEQPKLFHTYRETRRWNEILGLSNVGRLNETVISGDVRETIRVAEGFHEKKIAAIADAIVQRLPDVRLVLIAGPSASGKTTFARRLSVQLRVAGVRQVSLSMDNFYVNRPDTPRDPETGEYDFECLEALDLELFNQALMDLLAGKEVCTPIYDFRAGCRLPPDRCNRLRLEPDQVLLVEGIHGLNDKLTVSIPSHRKFRIYVSALTQLCLDDHNRIFTSEARLLRRIVRDSRYRGYEAETTLMRWPSVRGGERRNIFPFQEAADVMFNSALVYEVPVLKVFAEHYLLTVYPSSPAYAEAYRLLKFLEYFVPIFRDEVPQNSILREFIGGGVFGY